MGGGGGAGGGGYNCVLVTHWLFGPSALGPPLHIFSKISYVTLAPSISRVTDVVVPHGKPGSAPKLVRE